MDVFSGTHGSVVTFLPKEVLLMDATISLHPFFMHQLDVGPICLTTIAQSRVGRSRRVAERILEDIGIP